jgi:hypothetical protein
MLLSAPGHAQTAGTTPPSESGRPGAPAETPGTPEKLRRLETVTWNPVKCELTWVMSSGDRTAGQYTPSVSETYTIKMDTAIMEFHGENRGFEATEAEQVHLLMNAISRYAIESTIWWDAGEGDRLDSGPHYVAHKNKPQPVAQSIYAKTPRP